MNPRGALRRPAEKIGTLVAMALGIGGRARRTVLLGLVVAGLLAGLIGMHHLAVAPDGPLARPTTMHVAVPAEPAAPPSPEPHGDDHSGLLHLCLAVLAAAAVLLLSAASWRRAVPLVGETTRRSWPVRAWSRGPPLVTGRRLALLCVLRT